MLVVPILSTNSPKKHQVYVRLNSEGVKVFRPVPAIKISSNIFVLEGKDLYDPLVEDWEFLPGDRVFVQEKHLEGEAIKVAISRL